MDDVRVSGQVVDVHRRTVSPGVVVARNGKIAAVEPASGAVDSVYLMPGFVDAHVHVESSMMVPSEFARFAVLHGTVATVSDPHEIANVLGEPGVAFMVENGRRVPFKFAFGAPPCVPATAFETAGATLDAAAVTRLLDAGAPYLSEVMNFPGVLGGDPDLMAKIAAARVRGRPVDGHAPGLRGDAARQYIAAGIQTDHECVTLDEALDKLRHGMKILIREGSAARNFAALQPLLTSHPERVMFCSDDLHPDSLQRGHVNLLVKWAVDLGHDLFDVLRAACVNPVEHYRLTVGLLRPGDPADFIAVRDLRSWRVAATYIDGVCVARDGEALFPRVDVTPLNRFHAREQPAAAFRVPAKGRGLIRVIEAFDGQLVTQELHVPEPARSDWLTSDPVADVLKIAVVNRYEHTTPAVAFVRGFGLKRGAIAASVAHDSHNLVAVGVSDADLAAAINMLVEQGGGLAVVDGDRRDGLPLPVAGLMSGDGVAVASGYARLDAAARALGSPLAAPFMTLSFMALLVIPALKLSDKGLFDGRRFELVSLHV